MRSHCHPLVVTACLVASLPFAALADHHNILSDNDRAKAFMQLKFAYAPAVFDGDKFPLGDFLRPKQAEELVGPYTVTTAYYDADYQLVERPEKPGRYGAVASIKTTNQHFTRYATLFKTAQRANWWSKTDIEMTYPDWVGVDAAQAEALGTSLNRTMGQMIQRDIGRSDAFARFLAGASKAGKAVNTYNEPVTLDRAWWLTLKRRLNGNAVKYASAKITIPETSETKAPAIRQGSPKDAGMAADVSEKLDAVLSEWAANTDTPFIACVARHGVIVHHKAYSPPNGEPTTTDSTFWVASISKALSGSLFMSFVDRGLIDLTDPVEKFLPAFPANKAKAPATMHHLLTHGADMDGHFLDLINDIEHIYGEWYGALKIGQQHRYNGTSLAMAMKCLEQITGETLPALYKKHLFDPLGCEGIESVDAAAGTHSNAIDLARVGQMLANRGAYGDKRFFSEETFERMLPKKLTPVLGPGTDVVWGIGLVPMIHDGLSTQTIGHGSASSSTLRVDLENNLVITMVRPQRGENFGKYFPKFIRTVTAGIVKVADK
ncbi:MAG: CubicO group peptidase (beta-lactamase class C family) [Verrucomicrobiales bacterium]|jgi:CubicO group peptidase (beta-lactamase class C family)